MKKYIKLNNYGYDSELDTGWGNRFQIWKFGYLLNSINNFEFDLVVEKDNWPELKYIDIPYLKLYEVNDKCEILENNDIRVLDKTKNSLTSN